MKSSVLVLIFLTVYTCSAAQDKTYQFTVAAGTGITWGLNNLKKPGYKASLYAEKFTDLNNSKTYWLALDYLMQPPDAPVTGPKEPGSSVLRTTTYHKLKVITLNFGARKFHESGFLFGAGVGLGFFGQIMPTHVSSDGSDYYEQYEHELGMVGLSHQLQGGYKKNGFQLMATLNNIWNPFRATVETDYERATPDYFPSLSLTAGFSF